MRFLVVDDDPIVLKLIPMVLRQEGHEDIRVASTGMAALGILSNAIDPFDAILLDIEMPEMNGIDVCARIRQMPGYRSIPIIMLTARSDTGSIESAFSAGANDYITVSVRPACTDAP
jgi:CheY-like chemotaxis protein